MEELRRLLTQRDYVSKIEAGKLNMEQVEFRLGHQLDNKHQVQALGRGLVADEVRQAAVESFDFELAVKQLDEATSARVTAT